MISTLVCHSSEQTVRQKPHSLEGHSFFFFFLKDFIFIYLFIWLCWVIIAARGLSLVVASGGYSFVVVGGLLITVASLVAEHGL